ncbi:hypothetical protein HJFPF1_04284 [Paramyrothecium foliicola]|nr:hypothetical protein HJFPF1_04284 [Paramyrothecium foliicola]
MITRDVTKRLKELQPLVEAIRAQVGIPGITSGVVCRLSIDRNTIFYIASLTKAVNASAIGILVARGLLRWTTPAHDILPEMSKDTQLYAAKLNIMDILSHRTGKAWADALYLESDNEIFLPKEQAVPTFDYLPHVAPVRGEFMYNNHAYNIAGL